MLTSKTKTIPEIMENYSEFSVLAYSCNKLFEVYLD